ncbi:unnamed protein product [Mycena citricolor]|uniref:Endo-1,3(4)-beta-glucanase 1 carbohydrate binding domain-containing protein n=1 Tax=Mycena citricolor TaxID=2018698 RepID=A0AAD2H6N8_9AGAR|nr:unnamed protein product [Mycena citricolor]
MSRLALLILSALVTTAAVAQTLLNCGASQYNPVDMTCYDGNFLCPILDPQGDSDADVLLRCGDTCNQTTLVPFNATFGASNPLEQCGDAQFHPEDYVCIDQNFLCPIVDRVGYLRCGGACYSPWQYKCTNDALMPLPPQGCIPDFGINVFCNNEGCFLLECCPGLLSIADRCRKECANGPC